VTHARYDHPVTAASPCFGGAGSASIAADWSCRPTCVYRPSVNLMSLCLASVCAFGRIPARSRLVMKRWRLCRLPDYAELDSRFPKKTGAWGLIGRHNPGRSLVETNPSEARCDGVESRFARCSPIGPFEVLGRTSKNIMPHRPDLCRVRRVGNIKNRSRKSCICYRTRHNPEVGIMAIGVEVGVQAVGV
jgi:hypothetical protein